MRALMKCGVVLAAVGFAHAALASDVKPGKSKKVAKLTKAQMASITAGSNANFPPGQFPAGNPAHAPGNSNPNEKPK